MRGGGTTRTAHARYNQSAKGQARAQRYEQSPKGRTVRQRYIDNPEGRTARNRQRIFIGSYYVGVEDSFPYPPGVVERHLLAMHYEYRAKQAAEEEAFRAGLDAAVERHVSANEGLAATFLPNPFPDVWHDTGK